MRYLVIFICMLAWAIYLYADDCTGKYDRDCYQLWSDLDGNGLDTRQDILARDSLRPVVRNGKGVIVRGLWVDPYTGFVNTSPHLFDIEHAYALKDAHEAGAKNLSPEDKERFANDERHLFVTWKGSNRSKGARNIIQWIPSDLSFLSEYVEMRKLMASEYNLTSGECEAKALEYFNGAGKFFEKGINVSKLLVWALENWHIFKHDCFVRYKL